MTRVRRAGNRGVPMDPAVDMPSSRDRLLEAVARMLTAMGVRP